MLEGTPVVFDVKPNNVVFGDPRRGIVKYRYWNYKNSSEKLFDLRFRGVWAQRQQVALVGVGLSIVKIALSGSCICCVTVISIIWVGNTSFDPANC